MNFGSATKASKTEAVFFPVPGFFKIFPLPPSKAYSFSLPLTTNPKQESEKIRQSREDKCYDNIQETQPIVLTDGGIITVCQHFKYLGNFITHSLQDDFNIEHRLAQVLSEMVFLQPFWADNAVDIHSKYLIFCAIPVNLAL